MGLIDINFIQVEVILAVSGWKMGVAIIYIYSPLRRGGDFQKFVNVRSASPSYVKCNALTAQLIRQTLCRILVGFGNHVFTVPLAI